MAFVIPGSGFSAATVRMLLSSMMLMSRVKYPSKTFDETTEAARWLAGHGPRYRADELRAVFEEVRRRAERT